MLKLPPYGKTLYQLKEQNLHLEDYVSIFMGEKSWEKAKNLRRFKPTTMCLPATLESPFLYDWPVDGCEIMLFDTSYTEYLFVQNFIDCLLYHGAVLILFVSTDFQLKIFRKGI